MSNSSTLAPPPSPTLPPSYVDDGYSGGTTFCIFFFLTCICYFGGGMLVRKVLRGAEGHEMIPHYNFWNDLPNLIRDGILFTLNGCQPEMTYERI